MSGRDEELKKEIKKSLGQAEIIQEEPISSKVYVNTHNDKNVYKVNLPVKWGRIFHKEIKNGKAKMEFHLQKGDSVEDHELTAKLIIEDD